jgi:L-ascorbate metabolism protein UlaG (beta-lactamase superfamily)
VTRASLARCIVAPRWSDGSAIARSVPRADAIVLGHTHFDHALDAPLTARRTGARVFGSRSGALLCRAQGVPADRVEDVQGERGQAPIEREVGPFHLRFVPSAHSRFALGTVPFAGEIADCADVPICAEAYKCGAVFGVEIRVAGRTLYHLGSAELVDASVDVKHMDLLLMCVARRLDPGAVLSPLALGRLPAPARTARAGPSSDTASAAGRAPATRRAGRAHRHRGPAGARAPLG